VLIPVHPGRRYNGIDEQGVLGKRAPRIFHAVWCICSPARIACCVGADRSAEETAALFAAFTADIGILVPYV
jgi:hypothetical protein